MNNLNQILETAIQDQLVARSIESERAEQISKAVTDDLCQKFGGQSFYLPNNCSVRIADKHRAIISDFQSGMAKSEVCKKHYITSTWLRKLIKRSMSDEVV